MPELREVSMRDGALVSVFYMCIEVCVVMCGCEWGGGVLAIRGIWSCGELCNCCAVS